MQVTRISKSSFLTFTICYLFVKLKLKHIKLHFFNCLLIGSALMTDVIKLDCQRLKFKCVEYSVKLRTTT